MANQGGYTVNIGTGQAVLLAEAKTFSTGSVGYHATGKATLDGKRYQVNVMLVEIGSKPK